MPIIAITKYVDYDIPLDSSIPMLRNPYQEFDLPSNRIENLIPRLDRWKATGALDWQTRTGPFDEPSLNWVTLSDVVSGQFVLPYSFVRRFVPGEQLDILLFGTDSNSGLLPFPMVVVSTSFEIIEPIPGSQVSLRSGSNLISGHFPSNVVGFPKMESFGQLPSLVPGNPLTINRTNGGVGGILRIVVHRLES